MSRSQVPRGAKKKEICPKCGAYFWNFSEGASTTPRGLCTVCKPPKDKTQEVHHG